MRPYRSRRGVLAHVCALGMLAALVAVPTRSTAGAATGWTTVPSASRPAAPISDGLKSIQCRTPTNCVTAGHFYDPARGDLALAGRLTSTGWSLLTPSFPAPKHERQRFGGLESVACATATKCFAVGSYFDGADQALITRWDGKRWASVSTPHPGTRSTLSGISCPTSTRCYAVGSSADGTLRRTLVVRWNGTGWGLVPSPTPHPRGDAEDRLDAIACTSAANCLAVGASGADRRYQSGSASTLSLHWDGSTWKVVPSPNPSGTGVNAELVALACASPTACFASGSYTGARSGRVNTIVERWNGSSWSIVQSYAPASNQDSQLTGVSCPTAKACFAIGGRSSAPYSTTDATLFGRWSGNAWSFTTTPNSAYGTQQALSCASTTSCIAVGAALMQRWDGTNWTVMTTGASAGGLSGVSCASASMCVSVGTAFSYLINPLTGSPRGLIQHWNGTRFNAVAPPLPPGATESRFGSVACPATTECFAVGAFDDGAGSRPLIERWDGSSWSVQSVPAPPGTSGLTGVSCPDASTCFAIGTTSNPSATFVERWDGSTWTLAPAPSRSGLTDLSCSSATACLAVGRYLPASEWNGAAWTDIALPNVPGALDAELFGVACLSAAFCVAVGTSTQNYTTDSALIAQWNGSAWSVMTTPTSPSFSNALLGGVTCTSTTACIAVGVSTNQYHDDDFRFTRTLVEQWDGSTWSIDPSASPPIAGYPYSPIYASLVDVSCAGGSCIAVGSDANAMSSFTLAERSP